MLNKTPVILATFASLVFGACYGSAPPKLYPVPTPKAGNSPLVVRSEAATHTETTHNTDSICVGGGLSVLGASACVDAEYDTDRQVTVVSSTAQLGDVPISYGQFLVLSDPHYQKKIAALDDHRDACHASAVPEWIGIGLMVAGVVAIGASDGENPMKTLGWVGLGSGIATYAAGYVALGGDRCEEGRRLYNQLDHSNHAETMVVTGETAAREMQAVADQFNLRAQQAKVSYEQR